MEVFKSITGYIDYKVSNKGRVKSLKFGKDRILCPRNVRGYSTVALSKRGKVKNFQIHVLVAIAFLNHKPNGHEIVVDHIDHVKGNNCLGNLRLVTHRKNCSHLKKQGTSKYAGVCWSKQNKKWMARIQIKQSTVYLGCFNNELEAAKAYQNELKKLI